MKIIKLFSKEDKKESGSIEFGHDVIIIGKSLNSVAGEAIKVRVNDIDIFPTEISETRIGFSFAAPPFSETMRQAGIYQVQVLREVTTGRPPTPHVGPVSNVLLFALRPQIKNANVTGITDAGSDSDSGLFDAEVTVELESVVGKTQRVTLMLNEFEKKSTTAYAYKIPLRFRDFDTKTLVFRVEGIKKGVYLVRIRVDDTNSALQDEEISGISGESEAVAIRYVGPLVEIFPSLFISIQWEQRRNKKVRAKVTARDQDNRKLENVEVSGSWEIPNGSSIAQTRVTNVKGFVVFDIEENGSGIYSLTILEVSREGFVFDRESSELFTSHKFKFKKPHKHEEVEEAETSGRMKRKSHD